MGTAMVCKGAELHRDAFKLTDKGACFADGSSFDCDAVGACTGYRNSFPMFDHIDVREDVICSKCGCRTKDLNAFGQNPRRLYKQIFVPIFPDGQVAFFGFARPAFGSVPPTAERMGCLPPLMKLFLTKPRIWWKIMFGPFTMHQYLLQGPFANPRRAALVYSKQPVGDFLECSITAAFLFTAEVLSL